MSSLKSKDDKFIVEFFEWLVTCRERGILGVTTGTTISECKEEMFRRMDGADLGSLEFRECRECASKPGCPTLCPSCLHNRDVIENLKRLVS